MMDLLYWAPVIGAGLVAGSSTGLLGAFIVGMRIPFLGICVAHAALAGAVFGALWGLTGPTLLLPALAAAALSAVVVGLLDPQTVRADINVVLGILFSLMMGLAFLGLGLFSVFGVSDNEVRNLLWGSLAFCRWREFWVMLATAALELLFVAAFYKEMRAILFSRLHASAAGIHATLVWTLFLLLASLVLTVNFQTVGGMMIYSLLANPAVAASRLVRGYGATLLGVRGTGCCERLGWVPDRCADGPADGRHDRNPVDTAGCAGRRSCTRPFVVLIAHCQNSVPRKPIRDCISLNKPACCHYWSRYFVWHVLQDCCIRLKCDVAASDWPARIAASNCRAASIEPVSHVLNSGLS